MHQVGDEGAATSEKRNWNCYFRRNLFEIVIIYCENFANFTVHLDNFLVFVLRNFQFCSSQEKNLVFVKSAASLAHRRNKMKFFS